MAESKTLHPALTVNNIKSYIPVTLEMEKVQYSTWAELFKIHCTVYQVIDHIIPPKSTSEEKNSDDLTLWRRLDAVVLQWIYGTISTDLLTTIIQKDATAHQAWERLESIFHDNATQRALYLEEQLKETHIDNFPSASAYCQELKMIADQLANVGAPVSDNRLVLKLIAGLNENYDNVATYIQQTKPLPPFYEARSRLILEETRQKKRASTAATASDSALLTTSGENDDSRGTSFTSTNRHQPSQKRGQHYRGNNKGKHFYKNRGGGRGGGRGGQNHGNNHHHQQNSAPQPSQHRPWQQPPMWSGYPSWATWGQQNWTVPPCPYPTSSWTRPSVPQPGILGARPQAYNANVAPSNYAPTDIEAALHTMTLNVPDNNWYMDTGATSHMTASQGPPDGAADNEM